MYRHTIYLSSNLSHVLNKWVSIAIQYEILVNYCKEIITDDSWSLYASTNWLIQAKLLLSHYQLCTDTSSI